MHESFCEVQTVVPFVDLKAQYHSIRDEVRAEVDNVFESTQFFSAMRSRSSNATSLIILESNTLSALAVVSMRCDWPWKPRVSARAMK